VAERGDQIELACFRKRETPGDNPLLRTLCRLLEACCLLQKPLRKFDVDVQTAELEVSVSVFDRRLTGHYPFRTSEFAWLVGEHLASVHGDRPQITVESGTARPTVHAAWAAPTAIAGFLERLRGNGVEA